MDEKNMPHPGHSEHLCYLVNLGFHSDQPEQYNELVKNSQFVCQRCGRTAQNKDSLCKPAKL
jgi:hypothetical protein